MGTITEISDLDVVRWKNSQWRNLKVDFHFQLSSLFKAQLSNISHKFILLDESNDFFPPILFLSDNALLIQQVGWDECAAGERPSRVSIWNIEPIAAPFFICPPPFFRKRPRQPGIPGIYREKNINKYCIRVN